MASLSLHGDAYAAVRRQDGGGLVARGAELVELSERFYRGLFAGAIAFVGLAAVAALVALQWHASVAGPPITIGATTLIAAGTPFALWRAAALYRALRRRRELEFALVLASAALAAYPLRSELWWPSCALIMLIAILAPLRRTLTYCLVVLLANLAAHVVAGDLARTPAVSIIGLWIGYPFWSSTFSVMSDRLAAYVLRWPTSRPAPPAMPVRVTTWVPAEGGPAEAEPDRGTAPADAPTASRVRAMGRLTARQLQVTALLVDGLRYREVAACLSISEGQVQRHVANAIARAGVRTTNELVAAAVAEGLAPPHRQRCTGATAAVVEPGLVVAAP